MFSAMGKQLNDFAGAANYQLDSISLPVCYNIRISRSKALWGDAERDKHAAMYKYFYGVPALW